MSTKKDKIVERLQVCAYERLCVSCWSGILSSYLDQFLGAFLNQESQDVRFYLFFFPKVFDPNSGSNEFQSQVFNWPAQCLVQGLYVRRYLGLQHVTQPWPSLGGQQRWLPKFGWVNSTHWNLRSSDSQINIAAYTVYPKLMSSS